MQFEGRSRISTSLDIAPLIDVVFLLLIFFLLTSTFSQPRALELELPESSTAEVIAELPLVVTIAADRTVRVGEDVVSPEALVDRLRNGMATGSETRISVESDASVPISDVIAVMDAARSAGAEGIAIVSKARVSRAAPPADPSQ